MDEICSNMNSMGFEENQIDNNTLKLKEDLNTFMREIVRVNNYDADVYDLCVDCGHDLTWDQQYIIREQDIQWLKTEGLLYYFKTMHTYIPINDINIYNKALGLYHRLLELFSLTVEEE